ncbi:MAG TPA: hypothetical protein VMW35_05825 [Myxococcota bacterium]|jgi:hypothetical protein|nr:hypothetical protein [Myxococcota bacterium]
MSLRGAALLVLALASLAGRVRAAANESAIRFETEPLARDSVAVSAVAVDEARGRVAFGDAQRVTLRASDGTTAVVSRRGPIAALAFDGEGSLLVGTSSGLDRIDTEGRRLPCALGPGEGDATVTALAALPGFVAVGTAHGAWVARDGLHFLPVGGLPTGPVDGVALRRRGPAATLFLAADGEIYEAALDAAPEDAVGAVRSRAFDGQALHRAVSVAVDGASGEAVAVSADAVSVGAADGGAWRTWPLELPPGTEAQHALRALGRVWLTTARGVLVAEDWTGPWQRAAPPAGVAEGLGLAATRESLYVGTARGVLVGRASAPEAVAARPARWARSSLVERVQAEPAIGVVYQAALAYLDLGAERTARMQRGVSRRGLLPVVSLHLVRDIGTSNGRDYDESFVSGGLRRLHDSAQDRKKDVEAGVTVSWDLGDAAYHPDEVDVSREARAVVELRDDVLDEITQLYFERRRVLVALARLPESPEADDERVRLLLRADELAAGLDAWTGGWFSRHAPPLAP